MDSDTTTVVEAVSQVTVTDVETHLFYMNVVGFVLIVLIFSFLFCVYRYEDTILDSLEGWL